MYKYLKGVNADERMDLPKLVQEGRALRQLEGPEQMISKERSCEIFPSVLSPEPQLLPTECQVKGEHTSWGLY